MTNSDKYCITCDWTGVKCPSKHHICKNEIELHCILSFLEMERNATQCQAYNIQVFKFIEEAEVIKIRDKINED